MKKHLSTIIALILLMILTSVLFVCAEDSVETGTATAPDTQVLAESAAGSEEAAAAEPAAAPEGELSNGDSAPAADIAAASGETGNAEENANSEANAETGDQSLQEGSGDQSGQEGSGDQGEGEGTVDPEPEPAVHVHTWSEWTVTDKATYFKSGKKERVCTDPECGEKETAVIAKKTGKNVWTKDNGKWYYFGSKGKLVKGWNKLKHKSNTAKWYYFNKKGILRKSTSGSTRNKFVKADGYKFYFGSKKRPVGEGFITVNGKFYYTNKKGAVKIGKFKANDGLVYKSAKSGALSTIDYYRHTYRTFVIIDISDQTVKFYRKGTCKLSSDVVTGTRGKHDTPTGVFSVKSKQRGIYLSGPTWNSYVNYWIAFIGSSIGMHDASWRSSAQFSNHSTYINNGSHGCVNMRYGAVKDLYNMVSIGTTVIVTK